MRGSGGLLIGAWEPIFLMVLIAATAVPAAQERSPARPVRLAPAPVRMGNEAFVADLPAQLRGRRLGLVINHTAVLPDGTPLYRALKEGGVKVQAIFSPEHGISGVIEGGDDIADASLEGIPVRSLYGRTRRPTDEQISDIDALIYDIQDVGTRFYTYITTLKYVLEAAARAGLPAYVLDRPNPVGGDIVEGPALRPAFESFIGGFPIPIRYGLTCGELAAMMKGEGWVPPDVDLHIVPLQGWKREFLWEDTGLPWIPPSPNMPHPDAAVAYPGIGLLGGIILNQGLGTEEPFLRMGAPWIDWAEVIPRLPRDRMEDLELEPISYTPRSMSGRSLDPPYRDRLCRGVRLHIQRKDRFRAVHFTLELIRVLKQLYPDRLFRESNSLNLMFGTDELTRYLGGELSFDALMESVRAGEDSFRRRRLPYLLY